MAEQSTNAKGRAPDAPGAITLAGRPTGAMPEVTDLLMGDGFGPASDAVPPGHAPAVSIRCLLRQKWLMLALFALVAGAAIPCVWLFTVPLYESTAVVRVEPVVPKIVYATESNGMLPLYREYMNTQVNAIRSPTVFGHVMDRSDIKATHWYTVEGKRLLGDPLPPQERLVKALKVETWPNTQLIGVSISTRKGSDAKLIVDAVVDEYYKVMEERERLEYVKLIGKVRVQYDDLEKTIRGLRDLRKSLSKDSGLMDSLELRSQIGTKLNDLESKSMEVDRSRKMLRDRLDRLAAGASQPAKNESEARTISDLDYAQDPGWQSLHLSWKEAQHALELARDQYGESHPKVKLAASNVTHAQGLLAEREALLSQTRLGQARTGVAGAEAVSISPQAVEQLLPEKDLEKKLLTEDIQDLRKKVAEIQIIAENEEQLREKQQVFETVRNRLTTLETELNAPGRITIDSHGLQPAEPSRDRRGMLTAMALAGAAVAALGLGYLRSVNDSRIHELGDIQQIHPVPFLGRLPLLPKTSTPGEMGGPSGRLLPIACGGQDSTNSYLGPDSMTALLEEVRMVRTALLERLGGATGRAILITSPTSQVGKTSLAFLLARSLAATSKKVLLVEGDFYRPVLSSRLGLEAGAGLAALLARSADDAQAIRGTHVPGLDVLPVGERDEAFDPDVLADGVFAICMARWKRSYDFVVLDSPPVLPVADARILASHADGALLVVKATHNRRMETLAAFTQLAATRGGVLGVVMIGGYTPAGSYHYGYSSYAATPAISGAVDALRKDEATNPKA